MVELDSPSHRRALYLAAVVIAGLVAVTTTACGESKAEKEAGRDADEDEELIASERRAVLFSSTEPTATFPK